MDAAAAQHNWAASGVAGFFNGYHAAIDSHPTIPSVAVACLHGSAGQGSAGQGHAGSEWDLARALVLSYDLVVEPVTRSDAERAAAMWRPGQGLPLGDRLCLALTERLGATVWTAGTARQGRPGAALIR